MVLFHSLKSASRYTVSGGCWEGQVQPPCLGLPGRSYKVMCLVCTCADLRGTGDAML